MAEILYIENYCYESVYHCNTNKEFTKSMNKVAEGYVKTGSIADFVVIDSAVISDIICSNQCFYEWEMKEALEKRGVNNVEVRGLMGSTYYGSVVQRMNEELKENEKKLGALTKILDENPYDTYIDSENSGDFVLYKIMRKHGMCDE